MTLAFVGDPSSFLNLFSSPVYQCNSQILLSCFLYPRRTLFRQCFPLVLLAALSTRILGRYLTPPSSPFALPPCPPDPAYLPTMDSGMTLQQVMVLFIGDRI